MHYRMPCPKCGSKNTNIIDKSRAWDPPKTGVEYSCYMCGFRLYGQKAVDRVTEYQQAMENREALLKSMQEQEAKRMAEARIREARLKEELLAMRKEEEARFALEEEARKEAARLAKEREEQEEQERLNQLALILAQEEMERISREAEELRKKQEEEDLRRREEHDKILREKEEARLEVQRARARERAARWAEIEVMRKKDALRIENLRKEMKRERDARYRENKRARLRSAKQNPPEILSPPVEVPFPVFVAQEIPEPQVTPETQESSEKCSWHECEKPRRETSKYCSRECSVKNSRALDRARKQEAKSQKEASP